MLKLVHPESAACVTESLDLFSIPPTQLQVIENVQSSFKPISSPNGASAPLEFVITASNELFTDLARAQLLLDCRIVNADNSEVSGLHTVYPIPNILGGLFSSLEVSLNDNSVTSTSANYGYRSFFENVLSYSSSAKTSHLSNVGFYDKSMTDEIKRRYRSSKMNKFQLFGGLHSDLCSQPRYLINGIELRLKFLRNIPAFTLMVEETDAINKNPYIMIEEATLYLPRPRLHTTSFLTIQQKLLKTPCVYPISHIETKVISIQSGLLSKTISNISLGTLPKRIIVGLIKHTNYNGHYKHNPYKFDHCNLRSIALLIDGQIHSPAFETSYSDGDSIISSVSRSYNSIFSVSGTLTDTGNAITQEEYVTDLPIYLFDLTPDGSSACSYLSPIKTGEIGLNLAFITALPSTTNIIIYLEYHNVLTIDKTRSITTVY